MARRPPRRYKLTPEFVRKLQWSGKPETFCDETVRGLRVEANKHGASYKVQKDLRGKTIRMTLGTTEQYTLRDARTWAMGVIAQIRAGEDPRGVKPATGIWTLSKALEERLVAMRAEDRAPRTIQDEKRLIEDYLGDWLGLGLKEVTRAMCRERHKALTKRGKVIANRVLQAFSRAYRLALRSLDEELPPDPTIACTFNRVRAKERDVDLDRLPDWWERVRSLQNPIRREMHTLGLFSALRPGQMASIKREWIDLDARVIHLPRSKRGGSFDLPLSGYMVQIIQRALAAGDMLFPNTRWLFPAHSQSGHVEAFKEKTLPGETGHWTRHCYETTCTHIGLNLTDEYLLTDHALPGIRRIYVHESALFGRLLEAQERMSREILRLLQCPQKRTRPARLSGL